MKKLYHICFFYYLTLCFSLSIIHHLRKCPSLCINIIHIWLLLPLKHAPDFPQVYFPDIVR